LELPVLLVLRVPQVPPVHLAPRVTRGRLALQGLREPLVRRVMLEL